MNTTTLYVPPDTDEAYKAWKSTCGPCAMAAILGRPVMSLREAFQPYKGYTPIASMLRALKFLDVRHLLYRKDFQFMVSEQNKAEWDGTVSLVQWHGSWMQEGVHPGAALSRTHWVARDYHHSLVYDVNAGPTGDGGWIEYPEWERTIAPAIMASVKGSDGKWSVRSTILVKRPAPIMPAADPMETYRGEEDQFEDPDPSVRSGRDIEDEEGCCCPGECCMPGPHRKSECHTAEMMRQYERDAMRGNLR